jgi:hypothetical protein
MLPHQQRVVDELTELQGKLDKLNEFVENNPIFQVLSADEQNLLIEQSHVMAQYVGILEDRISLFKPEESKNGL